ncbi:hypothetical protein GWK48_03750 [Metallosphaera tengchongensis]|uniref:Ribbon-helix-helix protein, CopG family n=1 Tax=Metallosphaera tengchongensis TaxID=1532350 RepID=A0A6N0NRX0_9CREN|nr:hypothetical protein [Metallosphaera tengchongensis]QKQ99623.1 hypothetical protein GWK48_03750 [Metallosphaera tengchongensis]
MTIKTVSIRLKDEMVAEIDKLLPLIGAESRSQFIINAIKFCLNNDQCWKETEDFIGEKRLP